MASHRGDGALSRSVARGVAWLATARIITLALSVVSMAILARLLAPEDFGAFAALIAILSLPLSIFEGAVGLPLVQQPHVDDEFVRASFWSGQKIAWALTVLLICSSLAVPLKAANAVSTYLLQRQRKFGTVAVLGSIGLVGNTFVAVPLALLGWKLWALVAATLAGGLAEAVVGYLLVRHPLRFPRRGHSSQVRRANLLFALTQLLNCLALAIPNLSVGRVLGPAALGFYSRSWRMFEIAVGVAATPIQRTLIPAFAGLQGDLPRARRSLERALAAATVAFGVISAIMILQSDAIVRLVLGGQWTATILPMQLLFAAFVPRAAYKLTESVALGFGRAGQTSVRQAVFAGLLAAGGLAGTRFGITGVATGVALAMWAFYALSLCWAARLTGSSAVVLFLIHIRALCITAFASVTGWLALESMLPLGYWLAHAASLIATGLAAVLIVVAPARVLGDELHWARTSLLKAVRAERSNRPAAA
jgi:PST family polysaccharide transporter